MDINEELKIIDLCLELAQDFPVMLHCEYGHSTANQEKRNKYITDLIKSRKLSLELSKNYTADDRFFDDEYS